MRSNSLRYSQIAHQHHISPNNNALSNFTNIITRPTLSNKTLTPKQNESLSSSCTFSLLGSSTSRERWPLSLRHMPSWMRRRCDGLLQRCWSSLGGHSGYYSRPSCYCMQLGIRKVSSWLCCGGFGSNSIGQVLVLHFRELH